MREASLFEPSVIAMLSIQPEENAAMARITKSIALLFCGILAFTHGIPKPPRWKAGHLVPASSQCLGVYPDEYGV